MEQLQAQVHREYHVQIFLHGRNALHSIKGVTVTREGVWPSGYNWTYPGSCSEL